jgi:hydroxymethylbilane synthase
MLLASEFIQLDDQTTLNLLAALEDDCTRKAVTTERAFLSGLGGGCSVPVAVYRIAKYGIDLTGLATSPDGKHIIKIRGQGENVEKLGQSFAQYAISKDASEILALGPVK